MEELTPKKKKRKVRRSFIFGTLFLIFLILCVIASCYFSSDASNIRSIRIENNTFLSDQYLLDSLDINLDDKYIIVIPTLKKMKAKDNPLLEGITIEKTKNHGIVISTTKNSIVGYCSNDANEDNPINLILSDGSVIPFNSELIKSLTCLPLLYDMSEPMMKSAAVELSKVNVDVLSRISEINCVPFTYDDSMLKCVMDDHYDIYLPISQLNAMNHYFDMIKDINKESGAILYFEGVFLNLSDEEIYKKIQKADVNQEE